MRYTPLSGSAVSSAPLADDHCVNEIATPTHCTRTINATHAGHPPFYQSADGAAPPTLPPA